MRRAPDTSAGESDAAFATRWRDAAQLPVGPAQHARQAARRAVLSLKARTSRRWAPTFVRGLFCHYVFDDQRADFDRLLRSLMRHGRFIDADACLRMLSGERPVDGRYFHLSFDDGFRNNLTNAVPVLREHGVPAAFFVPTSIIGADRARAQRYCREIQYPATIEVMTWDDVERLRECGFDVGSHTRTHARFSDLSGDPARLEDEIAGSKRELESRLGAACEYISWPYGRLCDADAPSLAVARAAGYRACFGAYRGSIRPLVTDPFRIPRHHFEVEWPLAHVEYFARGNMEVPA